MSLKHSIIQQQGGAIFTIEGRICSPEDSDELIAVLYDVIEKKIQFLIIDIEKLDYITSSGLNFFIRSLTRVRNIGGELIISGLHGNVEKLFNISKLNEIFTFSPTVEEGLKRLNAKKA